jgi:transposase
MKISGQFENIEKADNFALIKTDIETCRRNGINEADALQKLCAGNPYTVSEIIRD